MKVDKMSISLPADLGDEVREAAGKSGEGLSGWLADAARQKLHSEALRQLLDDWELEHGPIPDAELARARSELGTLSNPPAA